LRRDKASVDVLIKSLRDWRRAHGVALRARFLPALGAQANWRPTTCGVA
jgi:hypothetical protein